MSIITLKKSFLTMKKMKGFSLIELMVAMVVGLFVAAIVATMYVGIIRANSTTVQLSRLNIDMQAALDIIARDIQRTGYASGAEAALERDSAGNPTSSAASNAVHTAMFSAVELDGSGDPKDLNADSFQCVLIRYDANGDGIIPTTTTSAAPELIGYRHRDNAIEFRTWTTLPQECDGNSDWDVLAGGDGHLDITDLTFTLNPVSSASGAYDTTGQRFIRIQMTGRSRTDNDIQLNIDRIVRLRNDQFK